MSYITSPMVSVETLSNPAKFHVGKISSVRDLGLKVYARSIIGQSDPCNGSLILECLNGRRAAVQIVDGYVTKFEHEVPPDTGLVSQQRRVTADEN